MLTEAAWRACRRGAMGAGGRVTNGVGHEATQRRGRVDAVQRDARDPHAHAEDRHPRRVRRRGGFTFELFRDVAYPRLMALARASLSTRRHPAEAASSDVGGKRRHRSRLSPPPSPRARSGRTSRTRSVDRGDRQHPARSHPSAMGDVRRRRVWPTTASRSSTRCTTCWPTVSRRPTRWPRRWSPPEPRSCRRRAARRVGADARRVC